MHRIDAPGFAPGNLFTEGNPGLGVPATVVSDDWANDVQEELCKLVENQGIALVKGTQTQVQEAIKLLIKGGGNPIEQSIANNQGSALAITGLIFPQATIKGGQFSYEIYRSTDSSNRMENGVARVSYRTATATWEISTTSDFDDAGVTLSIDSSGQVKYVSDNQAGTSYAGKIRITGIIQFKQTLV